jgi:molybdopterin-containing oxidoreductase family membrane subunit
MYEKLRVHQPRVRPVLAGLYWIMVSCNVITPQLFWFKRIRTSIPLMFVLSHLRERRHVVRAFVHHRHELAPTTSSRARGTCSRQPGSTSDTMVGAFGLFFTLFLLFCRYLPMIRHGRSEGRHAARRIRTARARHGHHGITATRTTQHAHTEHKRFSRQAATRRCDYTARTAARKGIGL